MSTKNGRKTLHMESGVIYPTLKVAASKKMLNYQTAANKLKDMATNPNDTGLVYLDAFLE